MITMPMIDINNTGFTFSNDKLTLNFASTIPIDKGSNGLYLDPNKLGAGLEGSIDNWTVKKHSTNSSGKTILGINRNVVPCVFTISRRKVISRVDEEFQTSNETKTVSDVINEFNAVIDAYKSKSKSIPTGLADTTYILKVGDFLQFREPTRAFIASSGGNKWPVVMDDANRYENDVIKAFFRVEEVKYINNGYSSNYMKKLTLYCIWRDDSLSASYTVGQTYTYTKS